MSLVIFHALSADRFSMSDANGEIIGHVTLNPKRGHTLTPAEGRPLTARDRQHAEAWTAYKRRERRAGRA